ncbi:NYN domain-containing protein [Thermococcus indicus]|uniref:NYN domain-containing protein n=1 Tax=Thermococcus indicus TaxID=2586643 RepID=UPI00197F8C27|nr:hypothetical protein [Thermococcus indicus]
MGKYEDYKFLLDEYKPEVIYASNKYFYFWDGSKFYAFERRGYKTFGDVELSIKLGFWNAVKKLKSDDSIKSVNVHGDGTVTVAGYTKTGEYVELQFDSEGDLFYYAMDNEFEDFEEFVDALRLGFLDGESFRKALSGGFANAMEYFDAVAGGFTRFDEYDGAKRLNINNRWEYVLFKELNQIRAEYSLNTIEEAHLIKILRDIAIGEKISLEILWDKLRSERNKILQKYNVWNQDMSWYGEPKILTDPESLGGYLTSSEIIRRFGEYDEKTKVFTRVLPGGFLSEDEYKDAISRGYTTRREYLDARKRGFVDSLAQLQLKEPFTIFKPVDDVSETPDSDINWECRIKSGKFVARKELTLNDLGISTEAELYRYATDRGFQTFGEFFESLQRGTLKRDEYIAIKKGGFNNALEFLVAEKLGYSTRTELVALIYKDYKELKALKEKYHLKTYGDALILSLLLNLKKERRKLSLDEIWQWLKECEYAYFNRDSLWYTLGRKSGNYKTFTSKEELEKYLIALLKRYGSDIGTYDIESKSFMPKLPPVIVDGSNVAWEGRDKRHGEKALARNIVLVVEKLKELGYSDIHVFVDASLRYQVEDKGLLEKLIDSGIVEVMPAEVPADDYVIKYARDFDAYIVSNDRYVDWIEKNPNLKEFIKTHRVTFKIHKGIVHFDKKIEGL